MNMTTLLEFTIKNKASDLHLSAGVTPIFRIDGALCRFDLPILNHSDIVLMINSIMNDRQRGDFKEKLDVDFSFQHPLSRFRVNAYKQERGAAAVFRVIPTDILTINTLKLPPIFTEIASLSQGLVLVTGPTGSGKSTTLAAIIDYMNTSRHQHILTLEDPIEFIHHSKSCLINQREIFRDTYNVNTALRSALRQDPDVILVGELRDLETIQLAMTAAETGHLVFATMHTSSASRTINRIIDVFPSEDKTMIRSMLSGSLQAVIAQKLIKKQTGGRIAAFEIMMCTNAIRSLIREDKIAQIYSTIQTGKSFGMQTLDQHLIQLAGEHLISWETAREAALIKEAFNP